MLSGLSWEYEHLSPWNPNERVSTNNGHNGNNNGQGHSILNHHHGSLPSIICPSGNNNNNNDNPSPPCCGGSSPSNSSIPIENDTQSVPTTTSSTSCCPGSGCYSNSFTTDNQFFADTHFCCSKHSISSSDRIPLNHIQSYSQYCVSGVACEKPLPVCGACEPIRTIPLCNSMPQVSHDCEYCKSRLNTVSTAEKLKTSLIVGVLKPSVPIKKKKGPRKAGGAGIERDSKMAKEMTTVLNTIPGMEKVRWQSIIQSTRGPEVGDRETQRRVKEAEVLVGKVFGGDVRKMLTLLMNDHLDFLVKFVSTTLSTSRRGHKKVRDQVYNALKEIKEREVELEGEQTGDD